MQKATGMDKWDKDIDVVIVGYGAAGATAAITVSEAGKEVLILEKAPQPGGSSSVCSGGMRYPVDAKQAARYLKGIGLGSIDDETALAFAEAWVEMKPWLEQHEAKMGIFPSAPPYLNLGAPDKLDITYLESPQGYGRGCGRDLFAFLDGIVKRLGLEVMLNTPARRLVQNPATKEILGVVAESEGKEILIRARKAVIMTLGGFAGNPEMLATYIEEAPVKMYPSGTPYCTGDGVQMVIDVGADLWHMNGIEWGTWGFKAPEFPAAHWLQPKGQSWILVNRLGKRFTDESTDYGHAKKHLEVFNFGAVGRGDYADWPNSPWYMVFDEKVRQAGSIALTERRTGSPPFITYNEAREIYKWSQDNSVEIDKRWIKKADSVVELAREIGVDPAGLQETITRYNEYCAAALDLDFKRRPDSLVPIGPPPYYAMECVVTICNTQGGPRRNARSQVVSAYDGSPIPRLYAGGEFGSVFGLLYPGACNLSECIVSGLISGRNALAEQSWE
ncbi:FAD-dependent oxidoreductase [Chloroflexota bacterium]